MTRAGSAFAALVALALHGAIAAAAQAEPISVDDLLGAAGLGDAWFAPDGRSLAYVRERPANDIVTTGFSDPSLFRQQVFVTDLASRKSRLIAPENGLSLRVAAGPAWSPDGKQLLLLQADAREYRLAIWDRDANATRLLAGRPASTFTVSDWAGDRLVYAVAADDAAQRFSNQQMLETLDHRWRATWSGAQAQVTVSSADAAFAAPEPPPGALMLALPTGESHAVARGDYVAVSVAPDGRHVAAVRLAERVAEPYYPFGGRGELQLFEFVADGLQLRKRFEDLDASFQALAWSPASDRLLVGAKPAAALRSEGHLYEVALRGMTIRQLTTRGVSLQDPGIQSLHGFLPIGWIAGRPAAVGSQRSNATQAPDKRARLDTGETAGLRFDVYRLGDGEPKNLTAFAQASVAQFLAEDERASALVVADGALWRVAPTRSPERLSAIDSPAIAAFAIDPHYPQPPLATARFRAHGADRVALWRIDASGKSQRVVFDLREGKQLVLPARGTFLAGSADLASAAITRADGWSTALDIEGADEGNVATINGELRDRAVAVPQSFTFEAGGRTLTGWFVAPLRATDSPAPAVMVVYGGEVFGADAPRSVSATVSAPIFNAQLLSAQGFAVIYPSMPIGAAADTDQAETLAAQAVAAVDALAARGLIDPKRVALMGQSFGGYSVAAILTRRSDRFATGIALAGIYDWMIGHGAKPLDQILSDDGRNESVEALLIEQGQGRFGKPFWDDPQAYIRNSPIFHVRNLDAPLLMLQGDLDFAITSIIGADRMYASLVRAGKKPTLVRYWGEGHLAYSPGAIRDQWARVKAWLELRLNAAGERR